VRQEEMFGGRQEESSRTTAAQTETTQGCEVRDEMLGF
jgi:hypothetical protein